MPTVLLLLASNVFMTFAWYGHLRFREEALWKVVLASWGIAFFEYCLQVPANRLGYGQFSAYQLKILQECLTLIVFVVFAGMWLGERLRWNHAVSFALVLAAVGFAFLPGADGDDGAASGDTDGTAGVASAASTGHARASPHVE